MLFYVLAVDDVVFYSLQTGNGKRKWHVQTPNNTEFDNTQVDF